MRKCSTKAERAQMFSYLGHHWGDFDWMTMVKHAQACCVKDESRRTDVGSPCRAIQVLHSACLAGEAVGGTVPQAMVDVLTSWGKKLRGYSPKGAPSIVVQAVRPATVVQAAVQTIPEEEFRILMKHGVSMKGKTFSVV